MAEAVSERGYANTPVADVLSRAGVSRETFYEQVDNKQECFLAASDEGVAMLVAAVGEALGSTGPERGARGELIDLALSQYLSVLAAEPAVARTFLVEVYAAGPAALARRVVVQARFVDAVAELVGAHGNEQRFACEALVAAASALVTQRICAGRTAELLELHEPLLRFARTSLRAAGVGLAAG
ncbi:MAG: TetR/AcrR family transcriptional regulator [Solirubrobacteraceae bacterium]